MKNLIFIILGSIALISCKKEMPQPVATPAVFTFDGLIDGTGFQLAAGTNDYYMYSDFSHDANMVYNFNSHLRKYQCTSCTDDIQIMIKDYQVSATGDPVNISNTLYTGYYPYDKPGGSSISTNVTFTANVTGPATSYFWDFGDGSTTTSSPGPVNHTYTKHGKYSVCLTVSFSSGPNSTICNEVNVEIPDNAIDYFFAANSPSGNDVTLTPSSQVGTAVSYLWDLGDGATSTSNIAFTHTYPTPGIYTVTLTVTNAAGNQSTFSRNVRTAGLTTAFAGFFDVTGTSTNPNPLSLSNVTVNYTDANGLVWTSNNSGGQNGHFFKIVSIKDHAPDANGYPTKKITANFNCTLYNGAGTKQLTNATAVFSISYPQ